MKKISFKNKKFYGILLIALILRIIFIFKYNNTLDAECAGAAIVTKFILDTLQFPNLPFQYVYYSSVIFEIYIETFFISIFGYNNFGYRSFALFFSGLIFISTYFFTKKHFSKNIALLTSLILAFGPLDFLKWNTHPYYGLYAILINIFCIHYFFEIYHNKHSSKKNYILLGIWTGIGIYNAKFIFPFIITWILYATFYKKLFDKKLLYSFSPILLINLFKIKYMIQYNDLFMNNTPASFNTIQIPNFTNIFGIFDICSRNAACYIPSLSSIIYFSIFVIASIYIIFQIQKVPIRKSQNYKFILTFILFCFLANFYVNPEFLTRFYLILYPFIIIIISKFLASLKNKKLSVILLSLIIIIPIFQLITIDNNLNLTGNHESLKELNKKQFDPHIYPDIEQYKIAKFLENNEYNNFFSEYFIGNNIMFKTKNKLVNYHFFLYNNEFDYFFNFFPSNQTIHAYIGRNNEHSIYDEYFKIYNISYKEKKYENYFIYYDFSPTVNTDIALENVRKNKNHFKNIFLEYD